ncbi:hypothetical protein M422DRAFT_227211 [Sphaerobolus stellatus SS14]|uniref:Natural resistance-associated macrophage protein n=1 Tax=Sphaerobolus stellatus (strain SS14) TaxID=990650 RepID=A0A0C9W387_SPHS4|nr:hypothetical protein M422DRAFT_227211 [Sphaerobolus stellatus SS14]
MSSQDPSTMKDDRSDDDLSIIEQPSPQALSRPSFRRKFISTTSSAARTVGVHFTKHAGAGVMASVAYFDPGNWSVDLQAGSDYGYKLLFVVLLAGLGAIVLQASTSRLGCVTGLDLASHCRLLLHDHPRHPKLVRRLFLYPLYALSEIAIIFTDLAELLGSAIALNLLFPRLPLWVGVLLTALDVLIILAMTDDNKGRPVRMFEVLIVVLVLAVLTCFIILIVRVSPQWGPVFDGYIPSKALLDPGALYLSIGILGATVMPHALFLGSSLGTLDRISSPSPRLPGAGESAISRMRAIKKYIRSLFFWRSVTTDEDQPDRSTRHEFRQNNSYAFIKAHLNHGMVDIVLSLLGFAVPINSAILILAGAVFFFDKAADESQPAGLFDVHDLISKKLGKAAGVIFALALLCAGQSASITATLAGQIVSEGFLEWKVSPFTRRLVTRMLGLIPSALVAALVGKQGIDTLLVASQVALSIVLPFVVFPLVYLTSSHTVMRVKLPSVSTADVAGPSNLDQVDPKGDKEINYRNSKIMMTLGYLIFALVVVANSYVLVSLMRGTT